MKIIGLTGGIGSGKTTVSRVFETFGAAVYNSDLRAKKIQDENQKAISGLKKLFGDGIYSLDGVLNRKKIAEIVFSDETMLQKLNALIHPLVFEDFSNFCKINTEKKVVILESAILIESGFFKRVDFSVLVTADLETRINRTVMRDSVTKEQVLSRIKNQMSDIKKKEFCQYEIINNSSLDEVENQVKIILDKEI
ncbi:MAG: dephospho-CoA kinase [Bacteroidales bacterium]|nr:dephospho-CoA kinase [Bacteroidales bacterium]